MEEKIKEKNPKLHKYLFTVTTLSKLLAITLFILLPFIGFYLGMNYQKFIDTQFYYIEELAQPKLTITPTGSSPTSIIEKLNITSTQTKLLKSEDLYSISLPQGWKKVKETSESPYGSKPKNYLNIRYENLDGDFLNIEINTPGTGFGADELWLYSFDENKNSIIVTKDKSYKGCIVSDESPMCVGGDNILSIVILGKDQKIKSNNYFFYAGNLNKEQHVDTNIYKQILESIVFK
ncbi:MAG: hypothetical protein AAB532_02275 [Patescibacteria group bacterium]